MDVDLIAPSLKRPRSDSEESKHSDGSKSTAVGGVTIGYESFLDIYLKKDDQGKVVVRISDERLETWLGGEKQGDHVTTYELFLRFCAAKLMGNL